MILVALAVVQARWSQGVAVSWPDGPIGVSPRVMIRSFTHRSGCRVDR